MEEATRNIEGAPPMIHESGSAALGVEDPDGLEVTALVFLVWLTDTRFEFRRILLLDGQLLEEIAADTFAVADAVLLPGADAIHLGAARADDPGDKTFHCGHDGSTVGPPKTSGGRWVSSRWFRQHGCRCGAVAARR